MSFFTSVRSFFKRKDPFTKGVNRAVAWIGTESKYLQEVKEDLEQLAKDIKASKGKKSIRAFFQGEEGGREPASAKDIREAFRNFKYVGRCENRLQKNVNRIDDEMLQMIHQEEGLSISGNIRQLKKLHEQIDVEAKKILEFTSLVEGNIKEQLKRIQGLIDKGEDPTSDINWLEEKVDLVLKWLNAITIDLREADEIRKKMTRTHFQ